MYGFKPQHAQGKPVQKYANGGKASQRGFVKGEGTATSDSIPARLSTGEYVLPADTVKAVGIDTLDALRAATHNPVPNEQDKAARGFFAGGTPGGVDEDWQRQMEGERSARTQAANSIASEAMAQSQAESDKAARNQSQQVFGSKGLDGLRSSIPQMVAMGYQQDPAAPSASIQRMGAAPAQTPAAAPTEQPRWQSNLNELTNPTPYKGQIGNVFLTPSGTQDQLANIRPGVQGAGGGRGFVNPANVTPAVTQPMASTDQGGIAGGAGRGVINPPATNPSAPSPSAPTSAQAATGNEIMPGVFKHGRGQYSDQATGMGMPAGFTGQPSAQNSAAWQRLADRSQQESMSRVSARGFTPSGGPGSGPVEPGSFTGGYSGVIGPTDTYGNMRGRTPEQQRRDAEVSAGSIHKQTAELGKAKLAALDAQGLDAARNATRLAESRDRSAADIAREGMQQFGATTRTGMQEQGANTRDAGRTALARDEFGLKKEAAGFQTRAAKRLEDLQTSHQSAKTPEERSAIAQQIRELHGKDAPPSYKSHVMPNIKNADGSTTMGGVYQENLRTGEGRWVQPQEQNAQALPPKDQLKAGQTYSTPRGPARWDGSQFIPV